VLGRGNQDSGLAIKQVIMRVGRIDFNRLGDSSGCREN